MIELKDESLEKIYDMDMQRAFSILAVLLQYAIGNLGAYKRMSTESDVKFWSSSLEKILDILLKMKGNFPYVDKKEALGSMMPYVKKGDKDILQYLHLEVTESLYLDWIEGKIQTDSRYCHSLDEIFGIDIKNNYDKLNQMICREMGILYMQKRQITKEDKLASWNKHKEFNLDILYVMWKNFIIENKKETVPSIMENWYGEGGWDQIHLGIIEELYNDWVNGELKEFPDSEPEKKFEWYEFWKW